MTVHNLREPFSTAFPFVSIIQIALFYRYVPRMLVTIRLELGFLRLDLILFPLSVTVVELTPWQVQPQHGSK